MPNKRDYIFAEISKETPEKVQLMRTIKAEHGFFGSIELEKDDLRKFKKNFDLGKNRVDIAVDYAHNSHLEAAGWITDITLENNDSELWIHVDWTEEAKEKVKDRQYRYLSADFSMKYIDPETDEKIENLLHGAGLTNRPFIRGMSAILSEFDDVELKPEQIERIREIALGTSFKPKEKDNKMPLEDVLKEAVTLSDADKQKVANAMGINQDESETAKQLSEAHSKVEKLEKEKKELSETAAQAEKDSKFTVMLTEGKAVEAQREAYMKGDVDAFANLSEEINTEGEGAETDDNGDPEPKSGDEPKTASEASAKLSEMATKLSEEKSIEFSDALSEVVYDPKNEKLYALSESGKE